MLRKNMAKYYPFIRDWDNFLNAEEPTLDLRVDRQYPIEGINGEVKQLASTVSVDKSFYNRVDMPFVKEILDSVWEEKKRTQSTGLSDDTRRSEYDVSVHQEARSVTLLAESSSPSDALRLAVEEWAASKEAKHKKSLEIYQTLRAKGMDALMRASREVSRWEDFSQILSEAEGLGIEVADFEKEWKQKEEEREEKRKEVEVEEVLVEDAAPPATMADLLNKFKRK